MESFFHTLKTELVHHQQYATREQAKRDIFAYIEGYHNRTRRHSAIGYISPIQMELKAVQPSILSWGRLLLFHPKLRTYLKKMAD
jgi:Integrase core domain